MKNIFDYATKELSQDAFLRWFLECANESEIEKEAKEFMCVLLNAKPKNKEFQVNKIYKPEDISDIRTWAQVPAKGQKIDIVVDYKYKGIDEIFIIEDKTVSSEHDDQLKTYRDVVKSWNEKRTAHFIYFKTDFLNENEKIQCNELGYKIFDIKTINEFFSSLNNIQSEILSDYKKHINKLYREKTVLSNNPNTSEWSFENWRLFFQQKIESKFSNLTVDYGIYHGTYFSATFYFREWRKYEQSTCLEFIVRKQGDISALIHPYNCDVRNGSWKTYLSKEVCVLAKSKLPTNIFKSYSKSQTIATLRNKVQKTNVNEVECKVNEVIKDFINNFANIQTGK